MLRTTLLWIAASLVLASAGAAQQPGPRADSAWAKRQQMMMQQMQAADTRLDKLVDEMNRATGSKKVEAMAAVINEMVAQRRQMRAHMMQTMDSGGRMMMHGYGRGAMMDSSPKPK
jgi:hypothetical protein